MNFKQESFDTLVLGTGIAGLISAIKCSEFGTVALVTKDIIQESSTSYAQGGIAAALIAPDTPAKHFQDTMIAGCEINNKEAVKILTETGPERVKELMHYGIQFDSKGKNFHLTREGAHSEARVLHHKDYTGHEITSKLIHHVKQIHNITIFEDFFIYQLAVSDKTCYGGFGIKDSTQYFIKSKATILAMGGAGKLFKYSSNPDICTGDGYILGKKAGCMLSDLEFVQFHPTTFLHGHNNDQSFLISEATRGEGAVLLNHNLKEFMKDYHLDGNLAPRDVVSRAIFQESHQGKLPVYLNFSKIKSIQQTFPKIYQFCLDHGFDLTKDNLPITPAAHYMMGGLNTDLNGHTNIHRLYAVGEVACTGVHGANRLASNSLLEACVFSHQAALHIKNRTIPYQEYPLQFPTFDNNPNFDLIHIQKQIQNLMWEHVSIVRSTAGLELSLRKLNEIAPLDKLNHYDKFFNEVKNSYLLAKMIIQSALQRKESCGAHYRVD